jgi:hypothetical protein
MGKISSVSTSRLSIIIDLSPNYPLSGVWIPTQPYQNKWGKSAVDVKVLKKFPYAKIGENSDWEVIHLQT